MQQEQRHEVTIVGGGLAGMIAAWKLAERGFAVTIYEASHRLGGKAGADFVTSIQEYEDHGYHIFPAWYLNVWKLIADLGIEKNFVDVHDFKQVPVNGKITEARVLQRIASMRGFVPNLLSGVMPFAHMMVFFFGALDLALAPYSERDKLDQITVTGFIRSRLYRTERMALQFQDLLLKGISCPAYEVSARTMRQVMRAWLRYPNPMYRIPNTNMHDAFIAPFERKLRELGVEIKFNHSVSQLKTDSYRVQRLVIVDSTDPNDPNTRIIPVQHLIMAIPAEKLAALIDPKVYRYAPSLGRVTEINTRPMASLSLYFKHKIEGMPEGHINFTDSTYGLTFIDIAQLWHKNNPRHPTILNLIASDYNILSKVLDNDWYADSETAAQTLFDNLRRYLPEGITWEDLIDVEIEDNGGRTTMHKKFYFQSHVNEPLFMTDAGAWNNRPDFRVYHPVYSRQPPPYKSEPLRNQLTNLYLAGDYCRTHIDLVCMEGALVSGLQAAEVLRRDVGNAQEIEILYFDDGRSLRWVFWWILRLIALPFVYVARLTTLIFPSRA